MPTNVVKTARDEHLWNKAKTIASGKKTKGGKKVGKWKYIMGIYKKMHGMKKGEHHIPAAESCRISIRAKLKEADSEDKFKADTTGPAQSTVGRKGAGGVFKSESTIPKLSAFNRGRAGRLLRKVTPKLAKLKLSFADAIKAKLREGLWNTIKGAAKSLGNLGRAGATLRNARSVGDALKTYKLTRKHFPNAKFKGFHADPNNFEVFTRGHEITAARPGSDTGSSPIKRAIIRHEKRHALDPHVGQRHDIADAVKEKVASQKTGIKRVNPGWRNQAENLRDRAELRTEARASAGTPEMMPDFNSYRKSISRKIPKSEPKNWDRRDEMAGRLRNWRKAGGLKPEGLQNKSWLKLSDDSSASLIKRAKLKEGVFDTIKGGVERVSSALKGIGRSGKMLSSTKSAAADAMARAANKARLAKIAAAGRPKTPVGFHEFVSHPQSMDNVKRFRDVERTWKNRAVRARVDAGNKQWKQQHAFPISTAQAQLNRRNRDAAAEGASTSHLPFTSNRDEAIGIMARSKLKEYGVR